MPGSVVPAAAVCAALLMLAAGAQADAAPAKSKFAGCFLDPPQDARTEAISQIIGHNFTAEHLKVFYSVCVCCNVTQTDGNATVLAAPVTSGLHLSVYGRRNCSHLAVTDRWLLLEFRGGDAYSADVGCSHGLPDKRSTVVVITCDSAATKTTLSVSAVDDCSLYLELRTPLTCPSRPPDGLSFGSIFCILFSAVTGTYLLVGMCYRRLICGAKGADQLPNRDFWRNLGHLQADGCSLVCRHGEPPDISAMSRSDGWHRIAGGSFTDSDRDDAPLQP